MAVAGSFSALDMGCCFIKDLVSPPILSMDVNESLNALGLGLLVLMGQKLLEMFKTYLKKRVIHMEVVFVMAIIAVARKVIILDVKDSPSATLLGIACVIIALSGSYYLFRRAGWGVVTERINM